MPSLLSDEAVTPGDTNEPDFWSSVVNPDWQNGPVFTEEQLAAVRNDPQMRAMGLGDLTQPLHGYLAGFGLAPDYTNLGIDQGYATAPIPWLPRAGDPSAPSPGGLATPAAFRPGTGQSGFQFPSSSTDNPSAVVASAPEAGGQDAPSNSGPVVPQPKLVQAIPDDLSQQQIQQFNPQDLRPLVMPQVGSITDKSGQNPQGDSDSAAPQPRLVQRVSDDKLLQQLPHLNPQDLTLDPIAPQLHNWPIQGSYALNPPNGTQGDGRFNTPRDHGGGRHTGIDITANPGTRIVAADDGVVVGISPNPSKTYGNQIVIDHGHGLYTQYAHLGSIGVKPGDKVKAGDQIGLSGRTGDVPPGAQTHLHFEVRLGSSKPHSVPGGKVVNPITYLPSS